MPFMTIIDFVVPHRWESVRAKIKLELGWNRCRPNNPY
jgi:hypothetical protein